ncbi:G-D-S-L family lipolytic protein [Yeosuana sp. MJ-SS3]|uniref:G-D-S-L family lipolytic protein n=1 Tax=Gilvirhabdus luticola TaxID=3079858 RepID=A0ABU3U343_9FLAO|nr:G-D-S-L family lipolytic protein [Yeosuana sp. MJ-SS3]MDU8884825.1 G-D-S-L family lipolytic protein [Yeosuana sp. MJ-SS3]
MKKININTKYIWLLAVLLTFTACESDDDSTDGGMVDPLPALIAGSANFSNYVALGDSNTSGMTDGALFVAGQQNSFPNLLSQKFALIGGGSFAQPLMNDNTGGLLLGGNQIAPNRLVVTGFDAPIRLEEAIGPVTPTTDLLVNNPTGPFNNMGIPLAKSFHLLAPGYGNLGGLFTSPATANPYFVRMTGTTPDATVLELAMGQNPSFFSLWIGSNDALGYATSGGDGSSPLTDPALFDTVYNGLVATLTSGGAQGVVANIPYVTELPHFTAVTHDPLDPSDPNFGPLIPTLNTLFGALNQVFTILDRPDRYMQFSTTANSAVVIKDETLDDLSAQITAVLNANPDFPAFLAQFGVPAVAAPAVANLLGIMYGQARKAKSSDLLTLSSGSIIGTVNADFFAFLQSQGLSPEVAGQFSVEGITFPLGDTWVLIPSEQDEIKTMIDNYNTTISSVATAAGLAFVDVKSIVQEMAESGYASDDFIFTAELVSGGAISADGLHGTARGNVIVANEIMKAIDATYGSNFEAAGELLDVGDYPTNYSPLLP